MFMEDLIIGNLFQNSSELLRIVMKMLSTMVVYGSPPGARGLQIH